ncbi:MAG: hypothetical protein F4107_02350 [Gemmatimonadetes bacterium]|nr:hypothetical protein [Gemmatimonadota bacterium]MYA10963.1 hypothetical protein [Gemmatimonadota bacterium]MYD13699.1 hypothetical protein [Gemmatimonadota bacterium]MYE71223.1 hypothetical protein [Gemmatimonadota bacterium]MYI64769.1 hypothetical protein [Gemmatimonadota bacterium]
MPPARLRRCRRVSRRSRRSRSRGWWWSRSWTGRRSARRWRRERRKRRARRGPGARRAGWDRGRVRSGCPLRRRCRSCGGFSIRVPREEGPRDG